MKKWICTVCGYIHEGSEPPDECPVCGADKSAFEPLAEAESGEAEPEKPAKAASKPEPEKTGPAAAKKKWICTVCGYIHEGLQPPEICPVCGADKSKFKELTEEEGGTAAPEKKTEAPEKPAAAAQKPKAKPKPRQYNLGPKPQNLPGQVVYLAHEQMLKHHFHPMTVHIPNGVIPMVFIFVFLTALTGCRALDLAAYCSMLFVVATMPFVVYSGYIEWQKRYRGFPSDRFIYKIIYATIVAASSVGVVIWRAADPDVLLTPSPARWGFVFVILLMLLAAIMAGLIGGKFVFRD